MGGILLMMVGLGLLVTAFFGEGAHLGGKGSLSWTAFMAVGGMFVFRGAFSLSLGPLPYIMTSEFFPQEARAAGTALSWMSNWASNFCVSLSFPIAASSFKKLLGEQNGVAVIFCIYIGFCVVAYAMVKRLLPETRGLRLEATSAAATFDGDQPPRGNSSLQARDVADLQKVMDTGNAMETKTVPSTP